VNTFLRAHLIFFPTLSKKADKSVKQVLITRNRTDAVETAKKVADYGFDPIIAPLFDIFPMPTDFPRDEQAGIIATSRHSLLSLTSQDLSRLKPWPLYTVGPTTAATAQMLGFENIIQGPGNAEGLAALILKVQPPLTPLLFLTGEPHRPEIEEALAPLFRLTVCSVYRSVACETFPTNALLQLNDTTPFWLHFSLKSAERASTLIKMTERGPIFAKARHVALSPVIAQKIKELGGTVCTIAQKPTMESLLLSLKQSIEA
jgi:uroporphyrinogen-III synthase